MVYEDWGLDHSSADVVAAISQTGELIPPDHGIRWEHSSVAQKDPAIAHNTAADEALVVYVDDQGSNDYITARRIDTLTGETLGSPIVLSGAGANATPDVAFNPAGPSGAAEYMVTYRRGSSLYAVRVAAGDGSLLGGGEQLIGSVSNSSTPVQVALAVFHHSDRVKAWLFEEDLSGATTFELAAGLGRLYPDVTFDEGWGRFIVAYNGNGDGRIYARWVDGNGGTDDHPVVAYTPPTRLPLLIKPT